MVSEDGIHPGQPPSVDSLPMHEPHEVFEAPSNPDISIWRYMNLAKFISMLKDSALHFARADRMNDEFEGSISKPTFLLRRAALADIPDLDVERLNVHMAQGRKQFQQFIYLNCWHMNEHESVAMWDLYLGGESQGIAIRSTYRRLTSSITDQRPVHLGKVNYVDYAVEITPDRNALHPYLYKRKSFEHEREIRAIHLGHQVGDSGTAVPLGLDLVPITVDLDRLVEAVYVSPKAPAWFATLVRDLINRYGRNWDDPHHSSLDGDPIY
ncbi:hypothetical protein [Mycobacterium sp.]|uniref:hypothetical protein n=2 Tax=Mycobacterium sp. TaxID=1785 RepID=UPI003F9608B2